MTVVHRLASSLRPAILPPLYEVRRETESQRGHRTGNST
jgi:hypothetical protein